VDFKPPQRDTEVFLFLPFIKRTREGKTDWFASSDRNVIFCHEDLLSFGG
jgi:hypothetical protein